MLSSVPALVEASDLWIADRNFCVTDFFIELQAHKAVGLIREHGQIRFEPLEPTSQPVRTENGAISEQAVRLLTEGKTPIVLRRIRVQLDQPDRNGEDTLYLLTQVPTEAAEASQLAELYRKRWRIEVAFLKMTVQLRCEINTLGYPKAALFSFAVAAVAFNVLAVIMAALSVAHPEVDMEQTVSTYYIANEMANMAESLDRIIDPEDWQPIVQADQATMAEWVIRLAGLAQLRKYKKHPRGKKKTAMPRKNYPKKPHVATARLLRK